MNLRASQFVLALALTIAAHAQDTSAPQNTAVGDQAHATPTELHTEAWSMLTDAAADKRSDTRIQAVAALATLPDPQAYGLLAGLLADVDVDVRTAAVLAAGQTHSTLLIGKLHAALDDPEPQVAFAAATTLWKLKDHSGEDILIAVADGDRRADATLYNGAKHTASKDLHDPAGLAKMGAMQGASILLGPFGFGVGAYEAIRKSGGNSARVQALEQIAEEHTPLVRKQLLAALGDKDAAVRASAAKAIGAYPDPEVARALAGLLIDSRPPVRYTAAAAYLRTTSPQQTPAEPTPRPRKSTRS